MEAEATWQTAAVGVYAEQIAASLHRYKSVALKSATYANLSQEDFSNLILTL